MQVQIEIEDKNIAYLLCSAIEGGIRYWAKEVNAVFDRKQERAKPWGEEHTPDYIAAPFSNGGYIVLKHDTEKDREGECSGETRLDREAFKRGLALMASKKYARHFGDFMNGGGDADTGDVFVQLCVFGKIVFG